MATFNADDFVLSPQAVGTFFGALDGFAKAIPISAAAILVVPVLLRLASEFAPQVAAMSGEQAVTVFAIVGGLSGFFSQVFAAQNLQDLDRRINVMELLPALVISIAASALASLLLIPPAPLGEAWSQFVRAALDAADLLPDELGM